ncbi:MAG: M48 family metallopeptidase [Gemmatimonadetes bacterium]|nr:M48 family metallopeptidase [Gemmatimonadota bacterium]MCH8935800.1 M48 family metallopeptidase [Gemmatimonadota bacterium]
MTGVPTDRPRKILTGIAPVSWEHPADRAALQGLRAVPGFDTAVKKILAFIGGEQGVRLIFQANAVKVGPKQFPRLHSMLADVKTTLDWEKDVELYVSQTPIANAMAVGFDEPFIVIHSGTMSLLNDDEQRVVLGHELGHVMSGHALYHTILYLIVLFGFANLPFLAGLALLPIRLALMEWYRKSELSSDRAGLLACQSREDSLRLNMKFAGGGDTSAMDLDVYMEQAKEYAEGGGPLDTIYKILNTLDLDHPFSSMRAAELQKWIDEGEYDKIVVDGQYTHRGAEAEDRPLTGDISEAAGYYGREAKETVGQVLEAAKKAGQAFTQAFKDATNK